MVRLCAEPRTLQEIGITTTANIKTRKRRLCNSSRVTRESAPSPSNCCDQGTNAWPLRPRAKHSPLRHPAVMNMKIKAKTTFTTLRPPPLPPLTTIHRRNQGERGASNEVRDQRGRHSLIYLVWEPLRAPPEGARRLEGVYKNGPSV